MHVSVPVNMWGKLLVPQQVEPHQKPYCGFCPLSLHFWKLYFLQRCCCCFLLQYSTHGFLVGNSFKNPFSSCNSTLSVHVILSVITREQCLMHPAPSPLPSLSNPPFYVVRCFFSFGEKKHITVLYHITMPVCDAPLSFLGPVSPSHASQYYILNVLVSN